MTNPDPVHPAKPTTSEGSVPPPPPSPEPTPTDTPEPPQLQAVLDGPRSDLEDAVAELTEPADATTRVKARTQQTADQARQAAEHARQLIADKAPAVTSAVKQRPLPIAAISAGAVLLLAVIAIRRRRSRT